MKFEIFKSPAGLWYWNLSSRGRIVCDCGEGYERRATMMRTLRGIFKGSPLSPKLEAAYEASKAGE